jgi:hypothetical protein
MLGNIRGRQVRPTLVTKTFRDGSAERFRFWRDTEPERCDGRKGTAERFVGATSAIFYLKIGSVTLMNQFRRDVHRLGAWMDNVRTPDGVGGQDDAFEVIGSDDAIEFLGRSPTTVSWHYTMACRPPGLSRGGHENAPIPKDIPVTTARNIRDMKRSRVEQEARAAREELQRSPAKEQQHYNADDEQLGELASALGLPKQADRSMLAPLAELAGIWRRVNKGERLSPEDVEKVEYLRGIVGI